MNSLILIFFLFLSSCASVKKSADKKDSSEQTAQSAIEVPHYNYWSANYSNRKFEISSENSNLNLAQATYGHLIAELESNFIYCELQIASKKMDLDYGNDVSLFAVGHLAVINMYYLGFGINYSDLKSGKIQPAWNPAWKFGILWNQTSVKEFWKILLGPALDLFCRNSECFTYKLGQYGHDIVTEFGSYYGGRSQNPQVFFTNIGLRFYF